MHVTGEPDGPPTSVGLPICDLGTGMWAVQGILAALYERGRTGRAASSSAHCWRPRSASARGPRRKWLATTRSRPARARATVRTRPISACRTKDRYLMVGAAGEAIWARCAKALGHPQWCEDPPSSAPGPTLT